MGETASHCEHRASSLVAAGVWKAHHMKSMWGKTRGGCLLCAYCVGFNASSTCKGKFPGQSGRPMLSILNWGVGRIAVRFSSLSDADSIRPEGDTAWWGLASKRFFTWVVSKSTSTWETSSMFIFIAKPTNTKWRGGRIHKISWHIFPFACF